MENELMITLTVNELASVFGGKNCCLDEDPSSGGKFVKARAIVTSMPPYVYNAVIGCLYNNSSYSFKGNMGQGKWVECTTPTPNIAQCMCYVNPCCSS